MESEPSDVTETAKQHFLVGCEAQKLGELERAVGEYEKSLRLVPGVANSLFNLGLCQSKLGHFPEAVTAFQGSLQSRPGDAETLLELGAALRASGDSDSALAAYRAAFKANPGRLEADANRALGLETGGLFGTLAVEAVAAEEFCGNVAVTPATSEAMETMRTRVKLFSTVLHDHGYTAAAARKRLSLKQNCLHTGVDFQQMRRMKLPDDLGEDGLGMLFRLFLLGQCLPRVKVEASGLPLGVLEDIGALVACPVAGASTGSTDAVCKTEEDVKEAAAWAVPRVSAPVQVYPLDANNLRGGCPKNLILATDWGTQSFLPAQSCVMQIGTDTLELLQAVPAPQPPADRLLDLCCGSGVQGLASLANGVASNVLALDLNPRCVLFTRINAVLNGFEQGVEAKVSDLYGAVDQNKAETSETGVTKMQEVEEFFDVILVNPPFVAVPSGLSGEAWSMYADGGPDGMVVVRRILESAGAKLRPGKGWFLLVGEMPNVGRWEWLAQLAANPNAGLDALHIFYDPAHTYSASQYAFDRAAERGGAGVSLWEGQLADHGIKDISNVLFSARSRNPSAGEELTKVRVCALKNGDPHKIMSENYTEQIRQELRIAVGLCQ